MSYRLRQTTIYCVISAVVLAGILAWWESRLFDGGWVDVLGARTFVVGTDVVAVALGAVLGLMLFRAGKSMKERVADTLLVLVAQLVVLASGGLLMLQASPLCMVWVSDHFEVVSPMEVRINGVPYTLARQLQLVQAGLQLKRLVLPQDGAARQSLLFAELSGQTLSVRGELHGPYQSSDVMRYVRPIQASANASQIRLRHAAEWQRACPVADVGWVPMKSRLGFHTALVSRKDGRICGVVDLDLWDR